MTAIIRCFLLFVLTLALPLSASAQFNLIERIPGQSDDEFGNSGYSVIEAANGDVLVFIGENGEITDTTTSPWQGLPANLMMHRKTRGLFWETPVVVDTAIENGFQSLGNPNAVVLSDGRILLTYFYHDELFPNFSVSFKVLVSDDHGVTWTRLANKDQDTAYLAMTPGGTVVAADWVENEQGSLSFHSSVYDAGLDTWMPKGLISPADPICSFALHAESETEWHFYYGDCVFGYGGTNTVFRLVTSDAGMNWGEAEELFTADSAFGTLGSVVPTAGGALTAVYTNGTFITYRMSSDGGMTWSDAENWTGDSNEYADAYPRCSQSHAGPLCVFEGKRGSVNRVLHIGVAGVSGDPLLGAGDFALNAGFNDAWYDPATAGQGFLIAVFPEIQQVFVAWFTFDTERPPESVEAILGEPGHRWLTAQGSFTGNTAELSIYTTEGGVFDSAEPPAQNDGMPDGTMTIEFDNCKEGMVSYDMTDPPVSGMIPIQRIVDDNVVLCEALGGQ